MLSEFAPPGRQPMLPWEPDSSPFSHERGYVATCTLSLPLEARITCLATDLLHAQDLIDHVLKGERQAPPQFRVTIAREQLWRLSSELQQLGLPGRVPETIGYQLNDLTEDRKLLEFKPVEVVP